ncbi:DUF2029 domain-containing protein [Candidatus Woesebacteria bacterium]|nr:DUF2029 domain-containing protein [Candidatus Woesebacteria bacterium]
MNEWLRRIIVLILVGFGIFTIARIIFSFQLFDFRLYYEGARAAILSNDPYSVQGVIYPPLTLVLLSPLAALPVGLAEDFWTLGSVFALIGLIVLILKSVDMDVGWEKVATIFGLALFSFPFKFTLGMGQINLCVLFLSCLTFFWYRKEKPWSAGFVLALAATLKVTPVLFLLFFLRKKQWAASASFLLSFLSFQLAGLLLLGFSVTKEYWLKIFPAIPTVGNGIYYNQAVTGWLARSGVDGSISKVLLYGLLAVLIFGTWRMIKPGRHAATRELLEFGLVSLVILLGTGLVWQHHYVLSLIPFLGIIFSLPDTSQNLRRWIQLGLVACYILIAWNIKLSAAFSSWPLNLFLSHVLYGGVVLGSLSILLLRPKKTLIE